MYRCDAELLLFCIVVFKRILFSLVSLMLFITLSLFCHLMRYYHLPSYAYDVNILPSYVTRF